MKRVLLVDDDLPAIEGRYRNIPWQSLGVEACFCANSARQAKQIIRDQNISIVITDIEMPEESGLELVEWINHNTQNVICVFLTSYDDFNYISRALRLRSCDYLLKPVPYKDMEETVKRAVSQLETLRQSELSREQAMYWKDSLPALKEQFWYEVICGLIPQEKIEIERQAKRRHIPYADNPVRLILFELPNSSAIVWEQSLVDVAMKNILSEVFEHPQTPPIVTHISDTHYFVLIDPGFADEQVSSICRDVVNVLESLFSGTLMCVIGTVYGPQDLYQVAKQMLNSHGGNPEGGLICVYGDRGSTFRNEMSLWLEELADGLYTQVLQKIQSYLRQTNLRRHQLLQLHKSLTWKLYQIISRKHLDVQNFFADEQLMELSENADRSAEGLMLWLECMLRRLAETDPDIKNATVVQIQNYIKAHLSDDLNRETISAITFLSVDYISHLFTQKTGQCLSDYITSQRIDRAKNLLISTDMSIAKVAIEVGYNNISYFSRLFKRETGVTPQKYRKSNGIARI